MIDRIVVGVAALGVLALAGFFAVDRYVYRYGLSLNLKLLVVLGAAVVIGGALAVLVLRTRRNRRNDRH